MELEESERPSGEFAAFEEPPDELQEDREIGEWFWRRGPTDEDDEDADDEAKSLDDDLAPTHSGLAAAAEAPLPPARANNAAAGSGESNGDTMELFRVVALLEFVELVERTSEPSSVEWLKSKNSEADERALAELEARRSGPPTEAAAAAVAAIAAVAQPPLAAILSSNLERASRAFWEFRISILASE